MTQPPVYNIDPLAFWVDPYPDLARLRRDAPVAFVPQLGATLMTRRVDIFTCEKNIEVFSSLQPGGLMTRLMGENMMRKDGDAHQAERRAIFPAVSPRTVKARWKAAFERQTDAILNALAPRGRADLVREFAMPVSAEALKSVTGLTNMHFSEMNRVSQGMIDGCANYAGDTDVEARCHDCTASIDAHISAMQHTPLDDDDASLLAVQTRAGMSGEQISANIKLAISGGQNEPRDAIAGTAYALLAHPAQMQQLLAGRATWLKAFEEYARWMSPIGMSPRRVAHDYTWQGIDLKAEARLFFMFGSANRDERVFERADEYDLSRDLAHSIPFGAGPHYCAGAFVSRCLIAEVALPKLFARLPGLRLADEASVRFGGWAFRGPLKVDAIWDV